MIIPKPMLDPWRDALLLELRSREIPGERIGEILAEIDTHCADSGEDPQEAFGDPVAYASSFEPMPARGRVLVLRTAAQGFATVCGILIALRGVDALADRTPGAVQVGDLVAIAVITAVVIVLSLPVPGLWQRGPITALAGVGFVGAILPQLFLRSVAFSLPGWVLLAGGVALLVLAWGPWLTGSIKPDLVIDPRTGRSVLPMPRLLLGFLRWSPLVMVLVVAVVTVVL